MKSSPQMAQAAAALAQARGTEPARQAFLLGILAGGYVGIAGLAMLTLTARLSGVPGGLAGLLSGLVFTTGLVLVVTAGGELFTGNCLMPVGLFTGSCSWGQILRNWIIVYLGNLVGSLLVVGLLAFSGLLGGDGAVAERARAVAAAKMALPFGAAFVRGILCNWLVTLAVWVTLAADSISDKVAGVLFPITAFVLSGYEHCVANMFFLPAGILAGSSGQLEALPWSGLSSNLIPVTLGNAVGGAVLVAVFYSVALGVTKEKQ